MLRLALAGHLVLAQVPEPPPAALEWRAPAACPDRVALVRGVEARLGRRLRPGELALRGVVEVHPAPPLYRLNLRLRVGDHSEERRLDAETCAALVDATAVLAALTVTAAPRPPTRPATAPTIPAPPAVVPPAVVSPAPEPLPEPPPRPAPALAEIDLEPPPGVAPRPLEPSPPPISPPPPPRRPGGFLRLQGGPEFGALPRVSGAVGLAGGVLWRRFRLELGAVYVAPRTGDTPFGPLRVGLAAGAAHGCARPGRGLLEVPLCAGLELGAQRGSIVGGRAATNWWLGAVVGAGVAVHVHPRVDVWAALQMVAGLVKPNYLARDPGPAEPIFQSAVTTGRLLLGVEIKFSDPR